MSDKKIKIVSVKDLVIGVKNDEKTDKDYRFKIEYGTFDVNLGDFVLIKGRNGCGKSTFLRLFRLQGVNYFKVLQGSITFLDGNFPEKSIHLYTSDELTRLNCTVSYIGQEEKFLTWDSAYSFIYNSCKLALAYRSELTSAEKATRLKNADKTICGYYQKYLAESFQCKYNTFKSKNVHFWSGGQQKMINVLAGVIKAEVCGLKLVVMDEPLNNLDGKNKYILNNLITDLRKKDVAILAITHCQIFDGVNKVLTLAEREDGTRVAALEEFTDGNLPSHPECLEAYQESADVKD